MSESTTRVAQTLFSREQRHANGVDAGGLAAVLFSSELCAQLNSAPGGIGFIMAAMPTTTGFARSARRPHERTRSALMKMSERQVGAVTILDLDGTITIDDGVERLKDKINSLILQRRTSVVLNLADVAYIDSGGLGQLVSCYSTLAKTTGGLTLLHVGKRNHSLLSITRLLTIFTTFESEADAVRSYSEAPVDAAALGPAS